MGSDGGGGGNPALLQMGGVPMGGLPIAGQGANIDPFKYGKFQNFLPDVPSQADFDAGARAPSAQGLTQEMFKYRGPDGSVDEGGGSPGGATGADIQGLRDQLAQLIGQKFPYGTSMLPVGFNTMSPQEQQTYSQAMGGLGQGFFNPGGFATGA